MVQKLKKILVLTVLACSWAGFSMASAEIHTIVGTGEYTMGDNAEESIDGAKEQAKESALRDANEKAGQYIEALSIAQTEKLTREEADDIAAELLEVSGVPVYHPEVVSEDVVRYHCEISAQIVTDGITSQLIQEKRQVQQKVKALFDQGSVYVRAGEYDKAIEAFTEGVSLNSRAADVYNAMSFCYAQQKNYQKAIECAQKALSVNPNEGRYHFALGVAYDEMGNYAKALAAFEKTVRLTPDNEMAYVFLAMLYEDQGEYQKGIEACDKFLALKPDGELAQKMREGREKVVQLMKKTQRS